VHPVGFITKKFVNVARSHEGSIDPYLGPAVNNLNKLAVVKEM